MMIQSETMVSIADASRDFRALRGWLTRKVRRLF